MNAQLKPAEPSAVFYDIPASEYHVKHEGELSASAIKRALKSGVHYKHWLTEEDRSTPALAFGRALHAALFEPGLFATDYVVLPVDAPRKPTSVQRNAKNPSDDTVLAIQWWDRWNLQTANKVLINTEDRERIEAMQAAVNAHPIAKLLIRGGHGEVTVRWVDEATGLPCKARADYLVEGKKRYVLDAKSCRDASPEGFARAVNEYGYHIQEAHYVEGFRVAGKPLDNYLILAIESEAPHAVAVYTIDAEASVRGHVLRNRGAARIKAWSETGHYPSYSDDITPLALPPWALKDTNGETA